MNTNIRLSRVLPAVIILTLFVDTAIAAYQYQNSFDCVDDLSELTDIASERAKHNGNARLHVNNVLYHRDLQQWCFRYEVD